VPPPQASPAAEEPKPTVDERDERIASGLAAARAASETAPGK